MIKSYNELTVGKYQELRKIDFEGLEPLEAQIEMLAVLTDMDEEDIFNMPLPDYQKLVSDMAFLNVPPQIDYKRKLKSININGEEYYILQDAREMTAGQYIDYQHYLGVNDFDSQLPNILTVFVLPKGKGYGEDYDTAELAKVFQEYMPIITAMEISAFFFNQSQVSIKASLLSLRWKMKRMMKRETNPQMIKMMEETLNQLELLKDSTNSLVGLTPPLA